MLKRLMGWWGWVPARELEAAQANARRAERGQAHAEYAQACALEMGTRLNKALAETVELKLALEGEESKSRELAAEVDRLASRCAEREDLIRKGSEVIREQEGTIRELDGAKRKLGAEVARVTVENNEFYRADGYQKRELLRMVNGQAGVIHELQARVSELERSVAQGAVRESQLAEQLEVARAATRDAVKGWEDWRRDACRFERERDEARRYANALELAPRFVIYDPVKGFTQPQLQELFDRAWAKAGEMARACCWEPESGDGKLVRANVAIQEFTAAIGVKRPA